MRPETGTADGGAPARVVCLSFEVADLGRWRAWFAGAAQAAGVAAYRAYPDNWDERSVDVFFDAPVERCDELAGAILRYDGRSSAGVTAATYVAAFRTA
jgi:hypothetical protein